MAPSAVITDACGTGSTRSATISAMPAAQAQVPRSLNRSVEGSASSRVASRAAAARANRAGASAMSQRGRGQGAALSLRGAGGLICSAVARNGLTASFLRGFGQHAHNRRPQGECLPPDVGEARFFESFGRLSTDAVGCRGGGTGRARLRDDRRATTRAHRPEELLEPRLGVGPHPEVVDGQHLVEGGAELAEVGGRSETQLDPALPDSATIAPGGLANHHLGVVDPHDKAVGRPAGQLVDREAGAEADLQYAIVRLHLEQSDRPSVPPPVGWAQCHLPAGQASSQAVRSMELGHDARQQAFMARMVTITRPQAHSKSRDGKQNSHDPHRYLPANLPTSSTRAPGSATLAPNVHTLDSASNARG